MIYIFFLTHIVSFHDFPILLLIRHGNCKFTWQRHQQIQRNTNMNVYSCLHKGNLGYCCRQHNMAWMFVPEFGQADNKVYKNIAFEDLVFTNTLVEKFEKKHQERLAKYNGMNLLHKLLNRKYKPQTIGGLLFYPMNI